ncbi:MAG: hypothetical protein Q9215_001718 [Flavoplaca cf. flavocitrina]
MGYQTAAYNRQLPIVKYLLELGSLLLKVDDVGDIVGQDGWTAAHHAAKMGDPPMLEAVLRHPSLVKGAKTTDGKTVEVVAMEAGNCPIEEDTHKFHRRVGKTLANTKIGPDVK